MLYKRKRKKIKIINKTRFFLAISLVTVVLAFTSIITVNAFNDNIIKNSKSELEYNYYVVRDNDTLWEISLKHKENEDIRRYIYKLKKINSLDSSTIYPGMKLKLPY